MQIQEKKEKLKKRLDGLDQALLKNQLNEKLKDFKIPKNISYVLERMMLLQQDIIVSNPFTDLLKRLGLKKEDLKDSDIRAIADIYNYTFNITEPFEKRMEIIYCMIYVHQIYDASTAIGAVDSEKERHFKIARGAFKKLLSFLNPYDGEILTKNSHPIDLMKIFSTIETSLSSIATLEDKVSVNPLEDIKNKIYLLSPPDHKAIAIKLFDPTYVYDMRHEDRKNIFDLLINDEDKTNNIHPALEPLDIFQLFTHLNSNEKRIQFLEILKTELIPSEINMISGKT